MSNPYEITGKVPLDLEHLSQLPRGQQRALIRDSKQTIEDKIRAAKAIMTDNALSSLLEKGRHLELAEDVANIQQNLVKALKDFQSQDDKPTPEDCEGVPGHRARKKNATGRMEFEQRSALAIMKVLKTSAEWLSELAKSETPGEKGAIFAKNANFGSQKIFTGNIDDDLARFKQAKEPEAAEGDSE